MTAVAMSELKIENAKITGTTLGIEDHGILTAFVHVEFAGGGCGFGGYGFDQWDAELKKRRGAGYGTDFIRCVLETVGVSNWEQLKGQHIRVEHEGWGGKILRIGHIINDKWFDPKALAAGIRAREGEM